MKPYSSYINIKRRYFRSVNMERDLAVSDSALGYVPTSRAFDALERFLYALSTPRSIGSWTITGVYGTGKSAFAHYLAALCSPDEEQINKNALSILKASDESLYERFKKFLPKRGLVRAVVTAQREPVTNSIVRALCNGTSHYWGKSRGAKPKVLGELKALADMTAEGEKVDGPALLDVIKRIEEASKTGILLVIDELGKNLEYAAQSQTSDELYILQQIAELPSTQQESKVFFFGLLHQSFTDYSHGIVTSQKNEWSKIQGRFEDIPFIESDEQALRLIGNSIDHSEAANLDAGISKRSRQWLKFLKKLGLAGHITSENLASIFPLHPISALVLPTLCGRYAQNDRTLFTFLTSSEPKSFLSFINTTPAKKSTLTTLKLHQVYDYFVETVGMSIVSRPQFQRWVEIQGLISDTKHLPTDATLALKTIGLLNLISASGALKATRKLVTLALCDDPKNQKEQSRWGEAITLLLDKGLLNWRKQIDELRIWEGSDFNIEKEIEEQIQSTQSSLADLLNEYCPLTPIVIQRHSYKTGTLRFFNRQYIDRFSNIENLSEDQGYDGTVYYLVDKKSQLKELPKETNSGRPVIGIHTKEQKALKLACSEFVALKNIETLPQLKNDGIARREVRHRLVLSRRLLDEAIDRSFDISSSHFTCFIEGAEKQFKSRKAFNSRLSDVCDSTYSKGLRLWNELINRRELTSQGSMARRELIEAMINNAGQERLGMTGNGPETSMFESLFANTEIYSPKGDSWLFAEPANDSGVSSVYKAIEAYCISATETAKDFRSLYEMLEKPPYGVRREVIPLLLLSILIKHNDDMSVYHDGTFVPLLGGEHLELLVKRPERFAVKYFQVKGLRIELFRELEELFSKPSSKKKAVVRNATLLGIVKPLMKFITGLPKYTLYTDTLSDKAKAVRRALQKAKEPDMLLFTDLPKAIGVPPISPSNQDNINQIKEFKKCLVSTLREIQSTYDSLLGQCEDLLYDVFSVHSSKDKLREDLRVRANSLVGQCIEPVLRRFILAANNENANDKVWLESLIMIVADKPADSWNDEDALLFDTKLNDLARRFKNLEALYVLQRDNSRQSNEGFSARRISITHPDGNEIKDMVWVDKNRQNSIDTLADKILKIELGNSDKSIQLAVLTTLIEKVLTPKSSEAVEGTRAKLREKKIG